MPRQIVMEVHIGSNEPTLLHRVLNFNEALLAVAQGDDSMSFPLDQIDKTSGQRIGVKSGRRLRRVLARVEELIEEHGPSEIIRLTVVTPSGRRPESNGVGSAGDQPRRLGQAKRRPNTV